MTSRTKRVMWIVVAAVTIVLLLREVGIVDGYWHSFEVVDNLSYQASSVRFATGEGESAMMRRSSGTSSNKWKETSRGAYLGTSPFDGNDKLQRELERLCQGSRITGIFAVGTISGVFWTPLIKDGSYRYRVSASVTADDGTRWNVTMNGEAALHVKGPCSLRRVRTTLNEVVAKHIVKQINGAFL